MRRGSAAKLNRQICAAHALGERPAKQFCRPKRAHAIWHIKVGVGKDAGKRLIVLRPHDELWVDRSDLIRAALRQPRLHLRDRAGKSAVIHPHAKYVHR